MGANTGENFSKKKWNLDNLRFFRFHQFNTNYAKQNWNPIKEKTFRRLKICYRSRKI
jgi:hypothetical protein